MQEYKEKGIITDRIENDDSLKQKVLLDGLPARLVMIWCGAVPVSTERPAVPEDAKQNRDAKRDALPF